MKYEVIQHHETIIIYDGVPYVLKRVTNIKQDETSDVCHYCDLRTMCKKNDGNSKLIELCMPNHVGQDCCFQIDYDYCDFKIGWFAP